MCVTPCNQLRVPGPAGMHVRQALPFLVLRSLKSGRADADPTILLSVGRHLLISRHFRDMCYTMSRYPKPNHVTARGHIVRTR